MDLEEVLSDAGFQVDGVSRPARQRWNGLTEIRPTCRPDIFSYWQTMTTFRDQLKPVMPSPGLPFQLAGDFG
ncbi:hypothetical protein [Mesorhizobium metallidurans]|uniref:hypothetical protein n=1 Tax=Mesorhizobium metallidurans TaxID=489722 RepID=UPI0012F8FBBA|nr:hypothetical protein [Mesorhizobium metallidurans]